MKQKKLILINPVNDNITLISSNYFFKYPPLALGVIAKLTPDNWDIEVIDENFEKFSYKTADLVGITSLTSNANRAYEIAKIYLSNNIPVIIGGMHASMMPEEAINYCTSIVVGDADDTWPEVIKDAEKKSLKKFYYSKFPDLKCMPVVDHSIFDNRYPFLCIQTSRGCPFHCDFCSVHTFYHGTYRRRPSEDVLQELESIKDKNKLIFFVDDNLTGTRPEDVAYVKELLTEIIKRKIKIRWFCQVSANIIRDEELLRLAQQSGCRIMVIGIEAESEESLKDIHKSVNIEYARTSYREVAKIIHKHGILISATMIYGMDHDDDKSINKRLKFAVHSNFDVVQITPLTPLPGTRLFKKIMDENRLLYNNFPANWDKFHIFQVVFHPKNFSHIELRKHLDYAYLKLYNKPRIYIRFLKSLLFTRSYSTALWGLNSNFYYRKLFIKK